MKKQPLKTKTHARSIPRDHSSLFRIEVLCAKPLETLHTLWNTLSTHPLPEGPKETIAAQLVQQANTIMQSPFPVLPPAAQHTWQIRASLFPQGTRFVREFGGELYVVTARKEYFVYQEKQYRSLTLIAKTITGYETINGLDFFGLRNVPLERKRRVLCAILYPENTLSVEENTMPAGETRQAAEVPAKHPPLPAWIALFREKEKDKHPTLKYFDEEQFIEIVREIGKKPSLIAPSTLPQSAEQLNKVMEIVMTM